MIKAKKRASQEQNCFFHLPGIYAFGNEKTKGSHSHRLQPLF